MSDFLIFLAGYTLGGVIGMLLMAILAAPRRKEDA